MPTPKTHRPSVSDIALALATRQPRSDNGKKLTLSQNAKLQTQVSLEVNSGDWDELLQGEKVYDVLVAKYAPTEAQS